MIGRTLLGLVFLSLMSTAEAWNSLGHRLIAQIAYDNLTPAKKRLCNRYNHALDENFGLLSFVDAAAWLDRLRQPEFLWLKTRHYIGLPFSADGTTVAPENKHNAVTAIQQSIAVLQDKHASAYAKGLNLRILVHVVGDIHQPMHAINRFSADFPQGDRGGNYFLLKPNPIANNLHAYWDNGAGLLKNQKITKAMLTKQARLLEQQWPCKVTRKQSLAANWAEESYKLAVKVAYNTEMHQQPSKKYQNLVQKRTEKRLALAGCRLAKMLNEL